MLEAEWLACDDPQRMLCPLNAIYEPGIVSEPGVYPELRTSNRKLRLFACATFRRYADAAIANGTWSWGHYSDHAKALAFAGT